MWRVLGALLLVLCGAGGCSLYSTTGNMMSAYTVEHAVPFMMASDDVDMACETGVSMGAFLMSFGRVTDTPHRAALVTLMSAGMCAEGAAWESELRQLRALKENRAAEAQDARIAELRAHALAAKRYYEAYRHLVAAFGEPGGTCPKLAREDELLYLLGLSTGMLAVLHDRALGGEAGVPMDIPRKVAQAAGCLDDGRWWGVPRALRAAVWAAVPGVAPAGADPWKTLAAAARTGNAVGVRLAGAFLVQSAATAGREEELRRAIKDHAASLRQRPADERWRMLDRYATLIIEHESDRLWTRKTGHRTPPAALGTFGEEDVKPADGTLLEGLGPEE